MVGSPGAYVWTDVYVKVASAIGALKRVTPFVTQRVAVQIYKALNKYYHIF